MLASVPIAARLLGLAGLIPFVWCAFEVMTARKILLGPGPALYTLQIYGAVILSFMGGVQWGLAVAASAKAASGQDWRRYGVSVLPAFIAWAGVWFTGWPGLVLMAAGFATLLIYDLWTIRRGEAPAWYGNLRIVLTAVVVLCLLAAATFGPF